MICVDSDVLIDLIRYKRQIAELSISKDDELATTVINIYELSINTKNIKEREQLIELLSSLELLPMSTYSSFEASRIFRELKSNGKEIGQNDIMIAGIMKSHNCNKIITNNKKHFERIHGLEIL